MNYSNQYQLRKYGHFCVRNHVPPNTHFPAQMSYYSTAHNVIISGASLIFEHVETEIDGTKSAVIKAYLDLEPLRMNIGDKPSYSFTEKELRDRIEYLQTFMVEKIDK